ncbi:MAG: hypothetical protein N3A63_05215 [Bacteroidetes bacterium]|nr:hypothetical protein [Bacteroidota bacterium]
MKNALQEFIDVFGHLTIHEQTSFGTLKGLHLEFLDEVIIKANVKNTISQY